DTVLAALERDLSRIASRRRTAGLETVVIGTATDPYQPAERRYQVTRSLLEVLAERPGLRIGIISKSDLMVRDIDLLRRIGARSELRVRCTVTTVDTGLARALEPRAPRPDLRLRAAAALAAAGIEVGVMCAPVLPAITDSRASLERVAAAAKAAGARYFNATPLFLQPCAQARYFPFLQERFPELLERYRRAYARNAYLPGRYQALLRARVEQIRRRFGFLAAMP
ncbi:MAG TPA: hypothetical protein VN515_00090, partial [Terriglobales bacterium]|nr:hypothetical protein [Terriglobales bacterium]